MNISILCQNIGGYDEKLDCLYTVYLLYPEIPSYNLIQDENYFVPLINKYFIEIQTPEQGDLLLFKLFNGFHFGIYAGDDKFFHCCKKHKLRLTNLSAYKKFLKGVYKWFHQ
ncbi:MAG TPA: NlpC/P60 family protein [Candidatus Gastranaerophilales bacterium]|nr:NlpC/P60 family protein [Candidatus Gastranaerophilales bacterium]